MKKMMRSLNIKLGVAAGLLVFGAACWAVDELAVVPYPQSISCSGKSAEITPIIHVSDVGQIPLARALAEHLLRATAVACEVSPTSVSSGIIFAIDEALDTEACNIEISDRQVRLTGGSYQGLVHATATLTLLAKGSGGKLLFPEKLSIEDAPDASFRSVMVDTARFWQPLHTLKETVDLAYLYKLNYLHLHLTDDQSFTFPSEAFPKLNSWFRDGSRRHYTKAELEELVEYARIRGVIVIPEIDMPGHAGCIVRQMPKVFGSIDTETGKARPLGNVVNMASEKTYEGLDTLIGEVADVFSTSPYIHIGADEVNAGAMKRLPEYKSYCEAHGLAKAVQGSAGELYAHFVVRLNEIVKKHGRQMIAWEGFHGNGTENARIPTDVLIMAWNNSFNPPEQLLKNGYTVINASWKPMYIVPPQNFMDSQEEVYAWDLYEFRNRSKPSYDRMPKDADIIGAQICYWEQTYDAVFPALRRHIPVMAERTWNRKAERTFNDFKKRFQQTDALSGKLFRPVAMQVEGLLPDSKETISFDKLVMVKLSSDMPGTIRYRLDDAWGAFPDANSSVYTAPLKLDQSRVVTAGLFDENNRLIGHYSQQKYSKITPAYVYRVLGPVPSGGWAKLPNFSTLTESRMGILGHADTQRMQELHRVMFAKPNPYGHIDTQPFEETNSFALELKGQLEIPESGEYLFKIQSPFGMARVVIGDKAIAWYEGSGKGITTGHLEAGVYPFRIEYFYTKVKNFLNIQMKLKDGKKFLPFDQQVLPLADWKKPADQLKFLPADTQFTTFVEKKYLSLATGKPVICSGGTQHPNVPANAVDGDISNASGWHCSSLPQWLQIDLEKVQPIENIKLYTYHDNRRHYRYFIEVSSDGKNFTEVVDQRGNTLPSSSQGFEHSFASINARYVRVTMVFNSANPGVHINEILVR